MKARKTQYPVLYLVLWIVALLSPGCVESPLAPVLPSSDIQLSIPLVNRIKFLSDFVKKDSSFVENPDGSYLLVSTHSFEPLGIDTVSFGLSARTQRTELGVFTVDPPSALSTGFTYQDLTGLPPPPVPLPVPAGSLTLPGASFGPLSNFNFISISSGTIAMRVSNTLPFPIQFTDPFVVRNDQVGGTTDTSEVARFTLAGSTLSPQTDTTVSSALAGRLIRNVVRFLPSTMGTPGSGGTSVTINSGDGIQVEFTFSGITADSASAMIPAQQIYALQDSVFVIDDSLTINSASFRSGGFDLILRNRVDADVNASVTVQELVNRLNGQSYVANLSLAGLGSSTLSVDASQYRLQTLNTGIGTSMTFSVGITALQSPGFRTLRQSDYLEVELRPTAQFRIEELRGRIKPTSINLSAGASGKDLSDISSKFKGSIAFDSVSVGLNLGLAAGYPVDYDLFLVAMNRKSNPVKIDSIVVPPPLGSNQRRIIPGSQPTVFVPLGSTSQINSFLSSFVPHLPDTFIVRGSVTVNPPDLFATPLGMQTISDTNRVYTSAELAFPVALAITGGEVTDTIDLGTEEKFPQEVVKSARSGTVHFEVTNSLPLTLSFRAALVGNTTAGRDTLLRLPASGSWTIAPPPIAVDGAVSGPRVSHFAVSLTGADMEQFNRADVLWFAVQIETADGPRPVKFRNTNAVRIKASANMVTTINKP